jgi:hypothetical protein
MLEQSGLLLKPWLYTEAPKAQRSREAWARAIIHPTTMQTLGYAAWDDAGIAKILYCFGRRRIHVFESEDESLLMTLARPWAVSRAWDVLDAEERLVGRLFRDVLCDGYGNVLATMARDGLDWQWRGEQGVVLGAWHDLPGQGCYFHFEAALEQNPFLRMTLLAGVLALPPWPGDISVIARPAV